MKYLLPTLLACFVYANLTAQLYINENFDSILPPGWIITDAGQTTGDSWSVGTVSANTLNGSTSVLVNSDLNGNSNHLIETLTSPAFDASSASNLFLDFEQYYRNSFSDSAIIEVFDGTQWQSILIQTATIGAFNNPDVQHIDITAYKNAAMRVRFRYNDNNSWAWYWLLDNISIYNDNCSPVTNFSATILHPSSIQLQWDTTTDASNWQIEWGLSGFVPGNASDTIVSSNQLTLDSLLTYTDYDFYIRSICQTGDSSFWAGPLVVQTPCQAKTLPYLDDIEQHLISLNFDTSQCWQQLSNSNYDWNIDGSGSTPSNGTGPSGAYSGTKYFYVEASSGNPGQETSLTSPFIDLNNSNQPALDFYYHMYGVIMGNLYVDVLYNNQWTTIDSIKGQQQASPTEPWLKKQVNLSNYQDYIKIRFRAQSAGVFQGDIALDDIHFKEVLCYEPQNILIVDLADTSATISWDEIGNATDWEIVWGTSGTGVNNGFSALTTAQTFLISNLLEDTEYEIFIRSTCNAGNSSAWVGPINFRTNCSAIIAPWLENVESHNQNIGFNISKCWYTSTISNSTIPYNWNIDGGGSTPTLNTGPPTAYSGTNYFYTEASNGGSGDEALLYFPSINIDSVEAPAYEFYYHMHGTQTGTLYLEIQDSSQWIILDSLTGEQQLLQSSPWLKKQGPIPSQERNIQLRFRAISAGNNLGDIALDNISVQDIACFEPTNFNMTYISDNNIAFDWDDPNNASYWEIEYGLQGFLVGNGQRDSIFTGSNTSIDSLTADTYYDFYLRTLCDSSNRSNWIGPFSYKTNCTPTNAPWTDSVEAHIPALNVDYSLCWSTNNSTFYNWNISNNSNTPTANTGPTSAASGQQFFYTESSNSLANEIALLYLPLVYADSLTQATLQYKHHMFGSDIGYLYVEIYQQQNWLIVDSVAGAQQNNWLQRVVYLDTFSQPLQLRFRAQASGGDFGDIAIDDISIEEAPPADIALNTVGIDTLFCNKNFENSGLLIHNNSLSDAYNLPFFVIYQGDTLLTDTILYLAAGTTDSLDLSFIQADTGLSILDISLIFAEDPEQLNNHLSIAIYHSYIQASIELIDSLYCPSDSNATLVATADGGIGNYSYLWLETSTSTDSLFNLPTGLYTVIVQDSVACKDSLAYTINSQINFTIQDSISAVNCFADSNASIIVVVGGGSPPYLYNWSNGQTTSSINGLFAGNYTLSINDNNGCSIDSIFNIAEPPALNIQVTDNGDGTATALASGGTGSYNFLWDSNSGGQTTATATGLIANTFYAVTVSDQNNCVDSSSISITITTLKHSNHQNIRIYPNPSKDIIAIEGLHKLGLSQIIIHNQLGQIVYLNDINMAHPDLLHIACDRLSSGIYFITIKNNTLLFSTKQIIQRE